MKKRQENLAIPFGGFSMNKEEILKKSRAKNKNKDIYEQWCKLGYNGGVSFNFIRR